jgi:alpha-beta hydrolase superfamily lysophospholipase
MIIARRCDQLQGVWDASHTRVASWLCTDRSWHREEAVVSKYNAHLLLAAGAGSPVLVHSWHAAGGCSGKPDVPVALPHGTAVCDSETLLLSTRCTMEG